MPAYSLHYFEFRGAAECARQLLALAGQDYEDVRVEKTAWPEFKPKTPFGQMPVLTVDGVQIAQSHTINRYLARQFGYAGKSPAEEALVDAIADQFKDFQAEIKPYIYCLYGFAQGDKDELYKTVMTPAKDKFFTFVKNYLAAAKSGYLVGSGLTWADLLITEHVATLREFVPTFCDELPEVLAWVAKVRATPAIAKWIETRPKTLA